MFIPVWCTKKIIIIDFTIYTQLFLVKFKSVVDGPILHSKSIVDGPILHSKSDVGESILHCKSIQNQSTTPFGRCGLTLDWFTTREIVIDFVIHQLSGPLISTIWPYIGNIIEPCLWSNSKSTTAFFISNFHSRMSTVKEFVTFLNYDIIICTKNI